MPVLGGVAMLQAIRQRGMALPVVLVTGYTTENLLDLAAGDPNVSVLAKPWSVEALAQAVHAAVHRTDLRSRSH